MEVERENGGPMYLPPDWPPEVRSPSDPEWETSAVAWLLDAVPPEHRAYEVLRRHPWHWPGSPFSTSTPL